MIGEILIKKMGFQTTTHDRCVYCQLTPDKNVQLLLWQVDNFLLACNTEQAAKEIFQAIGITIQFDAEKRDGLIPFEFLGVIKDYNCVNIKQTRDYIEMNCAKRVQRILKSHGWDTDSSKPLRFKTKQSKLLGKVCFENLFLDSRRKPSEDIDCLKIFLRSSIIVQNF